ncbi:MAG: hypothetical protein H6550_15860 [Chitinophagales bacterium]|nr:hypothetical protein [Chitinophagales bacterium]
MGADYGLGNGVTRKEIRENSYAICIGFPYTSGTFAKNMMVKLNSNGTVSPVAAVTDRPLGRVSSDWDGNNEDHVRVIVPFIAEHTAYADGDIDENEFLSCSGYDTTSGLPKYKVATVGDWVSAVCKSGASDTTTTGRVGILYQPFQLGDILEAQANIAVIGTETNLVGVDGSGSNAAPLVETEARLDAHQVKIDAIITALVAAGIIAAP